MKKSNQFGPRGSLRADRWYSTAASDSSSESDHDCLGIWLGHTMQIRAISGIVQRLGRCLRIVLLAEMKRGVGSVRKVSRSDLESILQGDVGEYGQYKVLPVLPDKVARYLYEFHAESYTNPNLRALPNDRESGVIHGILNAWQVSQIY